MLPGSRKAPKFAMPDGKNAGRLSAPRAADAGEAARLKAQIQAGIMQAHHSEHAGLRDLEDVRRPVPVVDDRLHRDSVGHVIGRGL